MFLYPLISLYTTLSPIFLLRRLPPTNICFWELVQSGLLIYFYEHFYSPDIMDPIIFVCFFIPDFARLEALAIQVAINKFIKSFKQIYLTFSKIGAFHFKSTPIT